MSINEVPRPAASTLRLEEERLDEPQRDHAEPGVGDARRGQPVQAAMLVVMLVVIMIVMVVVMIMIMMVVGVDVVMGPCPGGGRRGDGGGVAAERTGGGRSVRRARVDATDGRIDVSHKMPPRGGTQRPAMPENDRIKQAEQQGVNAAQRRLRPARAAQIGEGDSGGKHRRPGRKRIPPVLAVPRTICREGRR